MSRAYLLVGGPRHGEVVALEPGQQRLEYLRRHPLPEYVDGSPQRTASYSARVYSVWTPRLVINGEAVAHAPVLLHDDLQPDTPETAAAYADALVLLSDGERDVVAHPRARDRRRARRARLARAARPRVARMMPARHGLQQAHEPQVVGGRVLVRCAVCTSHPGAAYLDGSGVCRGCGGSAWHVLGSASTPPPPSPRTTVTDPDAPRRAAPVGHRPPPAPSEVRGLDAERTRVPAPGDR
jgi:hypothetical protein